MLLLWFRCFCSKYTHCICIGSCSWWHNIFTNTTHTIKDNKYIHRMYIITYLASSTSSSSSKSSRNLSYKAPGSFSSALPLCVLLPLTLSRLLLYNNHFFSYSNEIFYNILVENIFQQHLVHYDQVEHLSKYHWKKHNRYSIYSNSLALLPWLSHMPLTSCL